jgi:hypothetical protein
LKPVELSLDGLRALTDDVGMFQHTKFSTIDRKEGYTTDDNARALIAALGYHRAFEDSGSLSLAETYLAFLLHMQREDGRFHNLLGFDRGFQDEIGSEDCMGHALWACGCAMGSNVPEGMKSAAKELFDRGLPPSHGFSSPRAKAFTILGLHCYHEVFPDDRNVLVNVEKLAEGLVEQYRAESEDDWRWFEAYLTYANARLPQALFTAHRCTREPSFLRVALSSFEFLVETQIIDETFQPIGSDGWFMNGGERAFYDQQPIEASCMVEAALMAYDATGDDGHLETAQTAFEWYRGRNIQQVVLLNPETGTCYDGITPEGLNLNQGAEATLSYYLAYLKMREHNLV